MAAFSQKISIEGTEEIARSLLQIAQAAERAFGQVVRSVQSSNSALKDSGKAFDQLGDAGQKAFEKVGASARASGQEIAAAGRAGEAALGNIGNKAAQTAQQVSITGTAFRAAAIAIGAISAAAVAAGASMFAAAKSAATMAADIGKAAQSAGVALRQFQQQDFALQQSGLSAGDAASAMKKLGTAIQETVDKGREEFKNFGRVFGPGEEGARGLAQAIQALGTISTNSGPQLSFVQKKLAEMNVLFDPLTGKIRENAAQWVALAEGVRRIKDPAEQSKFAVGLFGDELGKKLLPILREGGDAISKFLGDFDKLNLGVSDEAVKAAQEFERVMKRWTAATKAGRQELGSLFVEPVAEVIEAWTTALRSNRSELLRIGTIVKDAVMPVIRDLLAVISGKRDVQTGWLVKLKDGVEAFGKAVSSVVTGLVVPAFKTLQDMAGSVAEKINAVFGTKLSAADVGLTGIITFLIGGFNSLALAIVSLFSQTGPLFDALKAKLATFGVDLGAVLTSIKEIASQLITDLVAMFEGRDIDVKNTWLVTIKDAIVEFAKAVPGIIRQVATVVMVLVGVFEGLAFAVNSVFGTEFTAGGLAVIAVIGTVTGAFAGLAAVLVGVGATFGIILTTIKIIGVVVGGLAAFFSLPVAAATALAAAIVAILTAVYVYRDEIFTAVTGVWDSIVNGAAALPGRIASALAGLGEIILAPFKWAADGVMAIWRGVMDFIRSVINASQAERGSVGGNIPGGEAMPFARGGFVRGAGTATSDSILARLSRGEFVVRAAAVKHYGPQLLAALNGMRLPVPTFSLGGLADGLSRSLSRNFAIPGFAGGGLVDAAPQPAGRPFVLQLPNGQKIGGMTASSAAIDELVKYSIGSQNRSGGKKPSWYR